MKFISKIALTICTSLIASSVVFAASPHSGFLKDYQRLTTSGSVLYTYLAYTAPEATAPSSIFLKPITVFPENTKFKDIDASVVKQAVHYADQALRAKLQNKGILAATHAEAQTTLEIAITLIQATEKGKKPLDFVPVRLITNPIKDALKGKALEASVRFELRLTENASKNVWYESVHQRSGEGVGRASEPHIKVSFKALQPALDDWVADVVEEIELKRPNAGSTSSNY